MKTYKSFNEFQFTKLTQALISLFAESPQEFLAVNAERWLSKEFGQEFVSVHLMRTLMFDGASSPVEAVRSGVRVGVAVVQIGDVVVVVVVAQNT